MSTRFFLDGRLISETSAVSIITEAAAADGMNVDELVHLLQRADQDDMDGEDAREQLQGIAPRVEIVVRDDAECVH